jgi:YD repeat-containing protein
VPGSVALDGVSTALVYDDMLRLTTATGAAGDVTGYTWDVADRPLSKTQADGSSVTFRYEMPPASQAQGVTTQTINGMRFVRETLDGPGTARAGLLCTAGAAVAAGADARGGERV